MPAPAAYGQAGQHAVGRYAHRDCGLPEQGRTSPAGLDPAAAPPPAGRRACGRARHAGPDSRQGSLRHHRRPDLTVAPAGLSRHGHRHLRLPERLFAPGSAGVTAPLASLPGPAARLGPQRHRRAEIMQYYRIYGITAAIGGLLADVRRPENGPRDVRSGAHAPPIRVPHGPYAPAGQQRTGDLRKGDRLNGKAGT